MTNASGTDRRYPPIPVRPEPTAKGLMDGRSNPSLRSGRTDFSGQTFAALRADGFPEAVDQTGRLVFEVAALFGNRELIGDDERQR